MHGRAIAEILVAAIDLLFLAHCVRHGFGWLRESWLRIGMAWWAWLVICSIPGIGIGGWLSFGHALAVVRFLLLVAALQHWVLAPVGARRWLGRVMAACALYIGGSAWLQFATGHNLVGYGREPDGELTGPFEHPRAGAPLSRLLFPAILPIASWTPRLAALVLGLGTMVLIGQRMPLLLTVLGLLVTALLLRRLRPAILLALVAGVALLGATAVVSPPAWYRLVTKFSAQMEHFAGSDYGLIARRAVAIAQEHPVLGRGFAGFRNACPDPATWLAAPGRPDGGGLAICNIHPHNHYLEAVTDSGLPGLALFAAMVLAWWTALLRGLGRDPDPLRVGLFVAAFIQEFPFASASSFTAIEIGGFFFVLLGWGLAEARYPRTSSTDPSQGRPQT